VWTVNTVLRNDDGHKPISGVVQDEGPTAGT